MAVTRVGATIIRAFNGSMTDAEGLLAVERATFNESPYGPAELRAMLAGGPQRGWLAIRGGSVVGFAIAFLTVGLAGPCWEIDLLAVHPAWRGRGLAARLIRTTAAGGMGLARRTRAAVAIDNQPSARAFARAGLRPSPEACRLLIRRNRDSQRRQPDPPSIVVEETHDLALAASWLAALPGAEIPPRQEHSQEPPAALDRPTFSLARQNGEPAGYAELIQVQTLLYNGIWLERVVASEPLVGEALIRLAVHRAAARSLDEVGAMVPIADQRLQNTLLAEGFVSLGDFCWFTAGLPLPGLAALSASALGGR